MSKLKELRLKRKLRQSDLAEKLGVSRPAVSKWETCKSVPQTRLLPKLAKVLRCKVNDLLC